MARGVLDKLKTRNAKAVKHDLATFEVPKGSTLTRRELITRCTNSNVHVVSVERQRASAIERQHDLESELRELRLAGPDAIPDAIRHHARTRTSLQLLARLQQAIAVAPRAGAAGDARLVDTIRLVDRHIEWLEARGIELPQITADAVVEQFDWHGDSYAASCRLVRSELLDYYRRSFGEIARDARAATQGAEDPRAKAQYQALRELGDTLGQTLASKILPRR